MKPHASLDLRLSPNGNQNMLCTIPPGRHSKEQTSPASSEQRVGVHPNSSRPAHAPHITHRGAEPLISGEATPGKVGTGPASTGLGPQAVPPPHPHPRQIFLEEAVGPPSQSPDGPLMPTRAGCGAGTSTILVWDSHPGSLPDSSLLLHPSCLSPACTLLSENPSHSTPLLLLQILPALQHSQTPSSPRRQPSVLSKASVCPPLPCPSESKLERALVSSGPTRH